MTISDLKDLKQVIRALRDGGVTSAEIDGVKLTLLPKPVAKIKAQDYTQDFPEANVPIPRYTPVDAPLEADKVETQELTDEQLMMWSSAGREETLGN